MIVARDNYEESIVISTAVKLRILVKLLCEVSRVVVYLYLSRGDSRCTCPKSSHRCYPRKNLCNNRNRSNVNNTQHGTHNHVTVTVHIS